MNFIASDQGFELDGKPFFLYSGEIQYFRIRKDLWRTHLEKLKAAGANTVSTYIPWSWHEISEGRFDFTGETDPQRDVLGFMDLAKEVGLYLSVKPGPYILAEFEDRGLPIWLTEGYPEIMAKGVDSVTYMHPLFKKYTLKWYDAILPHLASRQINRGGAIILMQVCNEVGLFNWLCGAGDTGKIALGYFHQFLKEQYKNIEALNRVYQGRFRSFASVPAPSKPAQTPGGYVHWNDWHDFHRHYYADYLSWLISEIRTRGMELQLFHNIPGWVFGRGTEYPINITFYAEIVRRHPELVLGVDHIPENPNYRNLHDDLVINEMVKAIQGGKKPIWAAEQQAGTREHNVHTFPNEMELFYKACIARGMTGMNFYMFSQGKNPNRRGAFGPTFYWMTALGHDGQEKTLYPVIAQVGRMLKVFGTAWAETQRRSDIHVAFYRPYYHDEFFYPLFGGEPKLKASAVGLRYEPKAMRNTYYFEGLLRVLVMQNRDFEMVDIQISTPNPKKVKQLWVVATDCMDKKTQEALADYVEQGGHLIIWPGLPTLDLKMRPCTVLQKRLGVKEGKTIKAPLGLVGKIDLLGMEDINVMPQIRLYSSPEAQEIAHTPDGQCCGLHKQVGAGWVTLLGAIFSYNIKEHLLAFEKLFDLKPVTRNVRLSNPAVQAHVRYGKEHAFVGLFNYTPRIQTLTAEIQDIPGVGQITIPAEPLTLEPLSGLVLPLHFPVPGTPAKILWSTAEILDLQGGARGMEITVKGNARETRQLAVQGPREARFSWKDQSAEVLAQGDAHHVTVPQGEREFILQVVWG